MSFAISSTDARTRLHTVPHTPALTDPSARQPGRQSLQEMPTPWWLQRKRDVPYGALGKLRIHATGHGIHPGGSQKMGCFRYHHVKTYDAPEVNTQRTVENRLLKLDLAPPSEPSAPCQSHARRGSSFDRSL